MDEPPVKRIAQTSSKGKVEKGKGGKFRELWSKFRRLKRSRIRNFHNQFVKDFKHSDPYKWHQKIKQLGGLDQMSCGKLSIGELDGLSDKELDEKVAERFAVVSQELIIRSGNHFTRK